MRKEAFSDNFMVENGYWIIKEERTSSFIYEIITDTEKWRQLFETALRMTPENQIITPEILEKAIKSDTCRNPKPKRYYNKKERPEGYMTIKQRQAAAKKRAEQKLLNRNANRNPK